MSNNKKEIKSIKKDIRKKYTGKISSIVKKVTAIAFSVGLVINVPQAIMMYNQWVKNGTLNNVTSVIEQISNNADQEVLEDDRLKDFKTIMEEYAQAIQRGDINRQQELDTIVEQGNYFNIIYQELQNVIITKLGYTPEKVQINYGRDGFSLTDKEKVKAREGVIYTTTGEISDNVKIKDENGNIVAIPSEMEKILEEVLSEATVSNSKGVVTTAKAYDKLISLQELENPVIEIADRELGD